MSTLISIKCYNTYIEDYILGVKGMAFKIDSKVDYSGLDKIMKNMARLTEREVSVGYDDTPHSDGNSMADIAGWQEEGVRARSGEEGAWHIPPRPFMDMASSIWASDIEKESAKVVSSALKGNESVLNKNLGLIGESGRESIQAAIDTQQFTKLSPTTIRIKRAKNSRFPETILVDSGKLYEGMSVKIK